MKINDYIVFAKSFADLIHQQTGQTYDGKPYLTHLEEVVGVLYKHNETSKTILCAAYLHDIVEDSGTSINTIEDLFGKSIAELVWAVTDEPGANRKERKSKTYPKIVKAGPNAIKIKIADRIANVTHSQNSKNERMFRMYLQEANDFKKNLYSHIDDIDSYWTHLENKYATGKAVFGMEW